MGKPTAECPPINQLPIDQPPMVGGIAYPAKGAEGFYLGAWHFPIVSPVNVATIEIRVKEPVDVGDIHINVEGPAGAPIPVNFSTWTNHVNQNGNDYHLQINVSIQHPTGGLLAWGYVVYFGFAPAKSPAP